MVYERETLIRVLIYHQRARDSGCICGWRELGRAHAEHIVGVYEMEMSLR